MLFTVCRGCPVLGENPFSRKMLFRIAKILFQLLQKTVRLLLTFVAKRMVKQLKLKIA